MTCGRSWNEASGARLLRPMGWSGCCAAATTSAGTSGSGQACSASRSRSPWAGWGSTRSAPPVPADDATPTEGLGIFAPVAGRIVYGDRHGIWGVDPAAPADPATRVQLTSEAGIPLGWSSDGTELLIMRRVERASTDGVGLFVLHADGSETLVTTDPMEFRGGTISPDGSRVVFVGGTGRCTPSRPTVARPRCSSSLKRASWRNRPSLLTGRGSRTSTARAITATTCG